MKDKFNFYIFLQMVRNQKTMLMFHPFQIQSTRNGRQKVDFLALVNSHSIPCIVMCKSSCERVMWYERRSYGEKMMVMWLGSCISLCWWEPSYSKIYLSEFLKLFSYLLTILQNVYNKMSIVPTGSFISEWYYRLMI